MLTEVKIGSKVPEIKTVTVVTKKLHSAPASDEPVRMYMALEGFGPVKVPVRNGRPSVAQDYLKTIYDFEVGDRAAVVLARGMDGERWILRAIEEEA